MSCSLHIVAARLFARLFAHSVDKFSLSHLLCRQFLQVIIRALVCTRVSRFIVVALSILRGVSTELTFEWTTRNISSSQSFMAFGVHYVDKFDKRIGLPPLPCIAGRHLFYRASRLYAFLLHLFQERNTYPATIIVDSPFV